MDNWTLTRSILAENSPYFLTGAKITYNPNKKLEIAGLVINGWQRIQRLSGNSLPSFGTQLNYKPSENITMNWSTFIGTDDPDTLRRMRYFNNFYMQFEFAKNLGLITGFDIGVQQRTKNSAQYNFWCSPVMILRYNISRKFATAVRGEYYQDDTGIIISTPTNQVFRTTGLSLNVDFSPIPNIMYRIEGRWLNSQENIFENKGSTTNNSFALVTSLSVKFSR